MTASARKRHLRRGESPLTWCGRRIQRVDWTSSPLHATCARCKTAVRELLRVKEEGR